MKSFISLCISCILFFLLTAESCDRSEKALKTVKAASYLLGSQDTTSAVSWQKVSRFDPYEGGKTHTYEKYPTVMTLQANGIYTEKSPENFTKGRYFLNKTKTAIAFTPREINGKKQAPEAEEMLFRHEIVKFSEDSLILQWQGRHGMVRDTYVIRE